ncbi:hypothetical protein [Ralstonia pseudosolanacearum]|uniref:hypothetical protein n=2 Tax=Ralstonia pseudosolanacearum TaxID=1310165 RepID=UPI0018D13A7F|nr:hypothetical protein [Ralstonia pseudosolanacearum]
MLPLRLISLRRLSGHGYVPIPEYSGRLPIWISGIQIMADAAGGNAMVHGFGIFPVQPAITADGAVGPKPFSTFQKPFPSGFRLFRQARRINPAEMRRINPQLACCTHQWDVNLFVYTNRALCSRHT